MPGDDTTKPRPGSVPVRNLHEVDQEAEQIEYWLTKTPEERLQGLEALRRQIYGQDYDVGHRFPRTPVHIRKIGS